MNALSVAIYNQLKAGAALTALIGGTALPNTPGGVAIFQTQAPDNQSLPYVVFSYQGGGDLNINPWRIKDLLIFVRAYSGDSGAAAGAIDTQLDALLHNKTLTVAGWKNFKTRRETDIEPVVQLPSGENAYCAGGIYRIRLSQ